MKKILIGIFCLLLSGLCFISYKSHDLSVLDKYVDSFYDIHWIGTAYLEGESDYYNEVNISDLIMNEDRTFNLRYSFRPKVYEGDFSYDFTGTWEKVLIGWNLYLDSAEELNVKEKVRLRISKDTEEGAIEPIPMVELEWPMDDSKGVIKYIPD